jgi:hypothetical protein
LGASIRTIWQMVHNPNPPGARRAQIVEQLRGTPGDHLVLVRYGAGPQFLFEWVYNDAEIDRSRVVFAHDMGPTDNAGLLDYFQGRRVWILSVDGAATDLWEITGRHARIGDLPQSGACPHNRVDGQAGKKAVGSPGDGSGGARGAEETAPAVAPAYTAG